MITTKPKFEIGQEVENGIIIGIVVPAFYCMVTNIPPEKMVTWNKEDPDWLNKFIYYIKFKEPIKQLSLEDFQTFHPEVDYFILKERYDALPLLYYLAIPEYEIK